MDFENIIGNDSLKTLIASHIRNKTLSHAYIIEGPKNSGKKLLAKEISKALCCEAAGISLPCGQCRSCKRIDAGYNTDIFTLSRGEKATIAVDDVRGMTDTLGYYPDDGETKVYIIDEADRMTTQAQNALLLSLEEPPEYVVFLLLTENSTLLLETVRSRSQLLRTQLFSTDFTAKWLRSHPAAAKATEEDIARAASVSRGALGTALSEITTKNSKSSEISRNAGELIRLLCTGTKSEAIIFASGMKYSRAEFEQFFDFALFAVRDLICIKCNGSSTTYFADEESARSLAGKQKLSKLADMYSAIVSAKEDITRNNAHIYAVMTTLAASV